MHSKMLIVNSLSWASGEKDRRTRSSTPLSDALKDVTCKLIQLHLWSNKIGHQGAAHLSDALKDVNCKLTQLNLFYNKIGDQGAAHLSDALKDVNCKLILLDLGDSYYNHVI